MSERNMGQTSGGVLVAGALAGVLALTPSASAEAQGGTHGHRGRGVIASRSDLTTAKRHYTQAIARFRSGDYAAALSDFQRADHIKATPQAERYIARCLDALGRFEEASQWYERFLSHVPDKMTAQADRTRARLTEIRATASEAAPRAVSREPSPTATEGPSASPPGDADSEAGRPPGSTPEQPAIATDPSVATIAPDPAPENHPAVLAYVAGGVALAAAGVGTAFGILALNDKSAFDANPTTQNASNRNAHALVADVALGVALGSAAASTILFLTHHEAASTPLGGAQPSARKVATAKSHPAWSITPTPVVFSHGAGAGLTVRF